MESSPVTPATEALPQPPIPMPVAALPQPEATVVAITAATDGTAAIAEVNTNQSPTNAGTAALTSGTHSTGERQRLREKTFTNVDENEQRQMDVVQIVPFVPKRKKTETVSKAYTHMKRIHVNEELVSVYCATHSVLFLFYCFISLTLLHIA